MKKKRVILDDQVESQECVECKEDKFLFDFGFDRQRKNNAAKICRECKAKERKKRFDPTRVITLNINRGGF